MKVMVRGKGYFADKRDGICQLLSGVVIEYLCKNRFVSCFFLSAGTNTLWRAPVLIYRDPSATAAVFSAQSFWHRGW
jgi:hypothetical protein